MIENLPMTAPRPTLLPYVEPKPGILIRIAVVIIQIVKKIFSIIFFGGRQDLTLQKPNTSKL